MDWFLYDRDLRQEKVKMISCIMLYSDVRKITPLETLLPELYFYWDEARRIEEIKKLQYF